MAFRNVNSSQEFEVDKFVVDFLLMINELSPKYTSSVHFRPKLIGLTNQLIENHLKSSKSVDHLDETTLNSRLFDLLFAKCFESLLDIKDRLFFNCFLRLTNDSVEFPTLHKLNLLKRIFFELIIHRNGHFWLEERLNVDRNEMNLVRHIYQEGCSFVKKSDIHVKSLVKLVSSLLAPFWNLFWFNRDTFEHSLKQEYHKLYELMQLLHQRTQQKDMNGNLIDQNVNPSITAWAAVLLDRALEVTLDHKWEEMPSFLMEFCQKFGPFDRIVFDQIDGLNQLINEKLVWLEAHMSYNGADQEERAKVFALIGCHYDPNVKHFDFTKKKCLETSLKFSVNLISIAEFLSCPLLFQDYAPEILEQIPTSKLNQSLIELLAKSTAKYANSIMLNKLQHCFETKFAPYDRRKVIRAYLGIEKMCNNQQIGQLPHGKLKASLNAMTKAEEDDLNFRKVLACFFYDPFDFIQLLVNQCLGINDALTPLVAKILACSLKDYCNYRLKHGQTIFFAFCVLKMKKVDQDGFEKLVKLILQYFIYAKGESDNRPGNSAPELLFRTCLLFENLTNKRNTERSLFVMRTCWKAQLDQKTNTGWLNFENKHEALIILYFWKQMQKFLNSNETFKELEEIISNYLQSKSNQIDWNTLYVDSHGSIEGFTNQYDVLCSQI